MDSQLYSIKEQLSDSKDKLYTYLVHKYCFIVCHQIPMKEDDLLHIYMNLCGLDNILEENHRLV